MRGQHGDMIFPLTVGYVEAALIYKTVGHTGFARLC